MNVDMEAFVLLGHNYCTLHHSRLQPTSPNNPAVRASPNAQMKVEFCGFFASDKPKTCQKTPFQAGDFNLRGGNDRYQ